MIIGRKRKFSQAMRGKDTGLAGVVAYSISDGSCLVRERRLFRSWMISRGRPKNSWNPGSTIKEPIRIGKN